MLWFGSVSILHSAVCVCTYEWVHWLGFYTVGKEYTVPLPDRNSFASHLCRDECDWKLQVWNFKSLVSLVKLCNPLPLVTCWRLCSSALRQRHLLERVPTTVRRATNLIQLPWNLGVLENSQEGGRDSEAVLPTNTPSPPALHCSWSDSQSIVHFLLYHVADPPHAHLTRPFLFSLKWGLL